MATRSRGSQFTLYLDAIRQAGLLESVTAAVAPEVRRHIERPPLATAWLEISILDALLEAVWQLGGQDGLDRVVEDFARNSIHKHLGALFRLELMMGYTLPDTFLPRANDIVRLVMVGTHMSFESTGPTTGRFTVTYDEPVSPVRLRGWRGVLRTLLDSLEADSTIGAVQLAPTCDRVSLDLEWVPHPAV